MEELFLRPLLVRNELDVVDQQHVNLPEARTERIGRTLLDAENKLISERFASDVKDASLWRTLHHRVSDRVKQVCLPETSTAVKEERVVCATWPLGDRLRCSVCKPARGTNDIRRECVSRVQVGWSRWLARINNAN